MLTGPSLFVFTTWGWKTRTSGVHLGVLLRQDGQRSQRAVMSNGLATFTIWKVAQLTSGETKILPDREAFAFIACGESQYSFSLLGGRCFVSTCAYRVLVSVFSSTLFRLLIPSQAYSAVVSIRPLLEECIDLDMAAEITTLRFCRGHMKCN